MSTQVQTVQNSGYQSLTQAAIGRVKADKRFANKVLNAVSVPFCAVADCFRAPAHFVANRLIHRSSEATVTRRGAIAKTDCRCSQDSGEIF